MMWTRYRRWQLPVLRTLGGFGVAVAFGIARGWLVALFLGVLSLVMGFIWYAIGADDTDVGELVGGRGDERQRLIRLRSAGFSLTAVVAGLIVASIVAAAAGQSVWPYIGTLAFAGVAYVVGLRIYGLGAGQESRRDPAPVARRAPHI